MRYLNLLLVILALVVGCKTAPTPVQPPKITGATYEYSSNPVLTMLEGAAKFGTFNVVRTNTTLRVNFTNAITLFNTQINTTNCDTITLKSTLSQENPVVYQVLVPSLELLHYYSTNNPDCSPALKAIKQGLEEGLGN